MGNKERKQKTSHTVGIDHGRDDGGMDEMWCQWRV